jgi:hypothetical protein
MGENGIGWDARMAQLRMGQEAGRVCERREGEIDTGE